MPRLKKPKELLANTKNTNNNYEYTDLPPNTHIVGYNKLIDNDGAISVAGNLVPFDTTLGTDDFENFVGISVYPNPTNSILNIKATENIKKAVLYNSLGQISIRKQINANETDINIKRLSNGILYILNSKT